MRSLERWQKVKIRTYSYHNSVVRGDNHPSSSEMHDFDAYLSKTCAHVFDMNDIVIEESKFRTPYNSIMTFALNTCTVSGRRK